MRACLLCNALVLVAAVARADILEWRDAQGSRHFTNSRESVPSERQSTVRVLVAERAPVREEAPAQPLAVEPRRAAEVIYDHSAWRSAYAEGFVQGALSAAAGGEEGNVLQVTGPLAVSQAHAEQPSVWPLPYDYPFVTTSFDRGRSRHLTLRMLLQDQFQLDRDGPFVYQRLAPIGLGPNFRPFLPRGLPHHAPRGGRVIWR
jgi:hypothetical protein